MASVTVCSSCRQHSDCLPTVSCLVMCPQQSPGHPPLRLSSPPCLWKNKNPGYSDTAPPHSTLFSAHNHKVGTDVSYSKKQQARVIQEEASAMTITFGRVMKIYSFTKLTLGRLLGERGQRRVFRAVTLSALSHSHPPHTPANIRRLRACQELADSLKT